MPESTDVVTGSFGFIGRYITDRLLTAGRPVKTITTHVEKPNPFGSKVQAFPYDFDRPDDLVKTLRGVDRLYNTYWIRFDHGGLTFGQAVQNTKILFRCAAEAGVRKVVHISVTHASEDSPLPYYSGKGLQEKALIESGLAYSIIRPTLVFGKEDILVNNIAWLIRKFPIFPIAGDGRYKLQPIFVGDLASIAIEHGQSAVSDIIDAIGPETYTYEDLVRIIASAIGKDVTFIHVPPGLSIILGKLIGAFLRDVILTKNELCGLMDEYLTSTGTPNGPTIFSAWLEENREAIGIRYSSELARHFRWSRRD
ncbi:MAG: NAD(P)H-binding protein [Candidatus Promineifilaceae bacterium]